MAHPRVIGARQAVVAHRAAGALESAAGIANEAGDLWVIAAERARDILLQHHEVILRMPKAAVAS